MYFQASVTRRLVRRYPESRLTLVAFARQATLASRLIDRTYPLSKADMARHGPGWPLTHPETPKLDLYAPS